MGFLSPLWLLLGAAAAVPILLHLLQRHQGPRVVFPALRYLRRAEKEHARRIRLRQLLLLALRVSVVVLAALAVARPFLRSAAGEHRPTAVALVIDNSLSSGMVIEDRRVLDDLKQRALETLARAGAEDRFWLIQAGAPWQAAQPGDAASTAERLQALEPTAAGAELDLALARARALLAAGAEGRAREIHLFTDLQVGGFLAGLDADTDSPPLRVWHPAGRVPPNSGVAAVELGGGLAPRAASRSTVTATLSHSGEPSDSLAVRLMVEGRPVAAANVTAGSPVSLNFPARPAGLVSGWVEIDADALRGDDRRYFVTRVHPAPRVAVTESLRFVDEALDVLARAGRLERVAPSAADVFVVAGGRGLGAAVRAGQAAVVLPPDSPLDLPALNQQLVSAGIPWQLGLPRGGGEARFDARDDDDELLRALSDARVRQYYPLESATGSGAEPPESSVLLRLGDGSPWAVRGALPNGGRYVLIASPLTDETSTLPTSAAIIPVLDRLVGSWTLADTPATEARPGEALPLPPDAEYVRRPDGTRDPVSGSPLYRGAQQPGIYQILGAEGVLDAFAVNPPPSESAVERLDPNRLRTLLPGWSVRVTSDPGTWERNIFQQRHGREIWWPVVVLLLAALLAEAALAASGRTRGRNVPAGAQDMAATNGARSPRPGPPMAPRGLQPPTTPGTAAGQVAAGKR